MAKKTATKKVVKKVVKKEAAKKVGTFLKPTKKSGPAPGKSKAEKLKEVNTAFKALEALAPAGKSNKKAITPEDTGKIVLLDSHSSYLPYCLVGVIREVSGALVSIQLWDHAGVKGVDGMDMQGIPLYVFSENRFILLDGTEANKERVNKAFAVADAYRKTRNQGYVKPGNEEQVSLIQKEIDQAQAALQEAEHKYYAAKAKVSALIDDTPARRDAEKAAARKAVSELVPEFVQVCPAAFKAGLIYQSEDDKAEEDSEAEGYENENGCPND